jgi:hypothetical protein
LRRYAQDKGITFWCSLNISKAGGGGGGGLFESGNGDGDGDGDGDGAPPDSTHLCYWNQPGVIPSFAVTCHVGNCVYEESTAGPGGSGSGSGAAGQDLLCPVNFTPPQFWTGDLVTRVVMALVAAALVAAAAIYVHVESR